jgi:hypothetical protein
LWITAEATFMHLDSQGTFEPPAPPEPMIHDESSHMEGNVHGESDTTVEGNTQGIIEGEESTK